MACPHEWSDSNIRIPFQQATLRMLESRDHSQIYSLLVEFGFDIRVARPLQVGRECQIHSTSGGSDARDIFAASTIAGF